jgi:adenylylsulfate kinase-like enzyme
VAKLVTRHGGAVITAAISPYREIRDEAREVFPNTVVPRDFDAIDVPFPEKGEPEVQRFEPGERARV